MNRSMLRAGVVALLALAFALPAAAQTVTRLPIYTGNNPNEVVDLGNGPTEIRVLGGNAQIWTMQGSGTGQTAGGGSSTAVILTATPTTVPCVGCVISGTAVTTGTTVSAYSGTSITLSAAMSVATSTTLSWGAACPSTVPAAPVMLVQGAVGADLPLYTESRICTSGQNGAGATLLLYPIGAH